MREPYSYRSDASVPDFPDDKPVLIFDGFCALCSAGARFVLRFDRAKRFRVLTAQSSLGRALYVHYGLDPDDYQTNLLIEDGVAWFKSEGNLRLCEGLGLPWSLASVTRVLPLSWRDRGYDVIARNRLRWFGARATCMRAPPGSDDRFLS